MRPNSFLELYAPSGHCKITRTVPKTGRYRPFALVLNGGGLRGSLYAHPSYHLPIRHSPMTVHDAGERPSDQLANRCPRSFFLSFKKTKGSGIIDKRLR